MKVCKTCRASKSLCEFNACGKYKQSYCKPCQAERDKGYRALHPERFKARAKLRYDLLTPEQKRQRLLAKKYVDVACSRCDSRFSKRSDTLPGWSGLCVSCVRVDVAARPAVKEANRQSGLAFIRKFGRLAGPKMENRRRGETHWHWRDGITPENARIRQSLEYRRWRKAVYERDGFTCVECGTRGGDLNADHIKPFARFPELRFDINNGRTLCRPCHYRIGWNIGKERRQPAAVAA